MIPAWESARFQNSKNLKISYACLIQNKAYPLFAIVHGFAEYKERYHSFVEELKDLPLNFLIYDQRGHGDSDGEKYCIDSFQNFTDDLEELLLSLRKDCKLDSKSLYLFGHSLGGAVASAYAIRKPEGIKYLFLSAPCFEPKTGILFGEALAKKGGYLFPKFLLRNPVPIKFMNHMKTEVLKYQQDSRILKKISLGFVREMIIGGESVIRCADSIQIPLTIYVAGEEKIVSTVKIKEFYNRVSSESKELIEIEGCYHEMFRDRMKHLFFEHLRERLINENK